MTTTEIRTMLEKAAKLIGIQGDYLGGDIVRKDGERIVFFNPATNTHDSRMLAIQAGILVEHSTYFVMGIYVSNGDTESIAVEYPPNTTTADKLQCELLAVLKCAAAIWDEREKEKL